MHTALYRENASSRDPLSIASGKAATSMVLPRLAFKKDTRSARKASSVQNGRGAREEGDDEGSSTGLIA